MRQLKITQQITNRNQESINRYFQEINKYSMISAEEEVELTLKIKSGDAKALEKLVVANLRFVISVAKQYQNRGLSFSDLINEGNMGLVKAAKKFDETRGFKFISYAVWWIRQSIIQAILEQTRIVRLPINRLGAINKISQALPYLEQEFEREPTVNEIASHLDLSNDEVQIATINKRRQLSFDMPVSQNEESDFSLYDFIKCESIPSPDNGLMTESLSINIKRALKKLNNREESILVMSFGLNKSAIYSQQDIAIKYGMSTERVRQIRSKALIKLKMILEGNEAFL